MNYGKKIFLCILCLSSFFLLSSLAFAQYFGTLPDSGLVYALGSGYSGGGYSNGGYYPAPYTAQPSYGYPYQSSWGSPYTNPWSNQWGSPYGNQWSNWGQPYTPYPYGNQYSFSPYMNPYTPSPYMNPYTPYSYGNQYSFSPYMNPYAPYSPQYSDADEDVDENDDGDTITLEVGETLSIILKSNISTGYKWSLDADSLDTDIVKKKSSNYFQGYSNTSWYWSGSVGTGGTEQWIFEAKGVGTTTIELEYAKGNDVDETFEIEVKVED